MSKVSVLLVDKSQDNKGIIANASFVLGLTAGRELPDETFGPNVVDGDSSEHRYLTNIGHYVRKAGQSKLRALREYFVEQPDTVVVDYTEDAAPADYTEYEKTLGAHSGDAISYRAVYVYGPEEVVVPKTKNLSVLN